jgi:hypothetical protein
VDLCGCATAVQVFPQALVLDAPEAEQRGGRDLRLRVVHAHPGPLGQDRRAKGRDENGDATYVTYRLEPHAGGTRFTYEHTGFTGIGGFVMKLRPTSTLKPRAGPHHGPRID